MISHPQVMPENRIIFASSNRLRSSSQMTRLRRLRNAESTIPFLHTIFSISSNFQVLLATVTPSSFLMVEGSSGCPKIPSWLPLRHRNLLLPDEGTHYFQSNVASHICFCTSHPNSFAMNYCLSSSSAGVFHCLSMFLSSDMQLHTCVNGK